jgi:intein-encoded DNA endonuclease-like protein
MLAMAISLTRYMTNQVSAEMMTKIEKDWISKHRERLQQIDARTPRQVLREFADDNDLTVADIDSQMDWTVWEYDSLTDLTMDTPTTDTEVTNSE